MPGILEYEKTDGLGLAEMVRKKQVTPAELLESAILRIERHNPRLNAVITTMYDQARARAAGPLPDGPFTGVPFLLKDLLAAFAGVRLASGCRARRDHTPDWTSELVTRFRAAGVVIAGKTNTPEFGLVGWTEPDLFGPTRNPWDTDRTPGGSSGGSAAAVAAGFVPLASGGDGGGSIRIPSSFCGLFGLKPTRFRTPTGPKLGRIWQGAAVEHVVTRSVRDSAAMLDATQGPDRGAPFASPPPGKFLEAVGQDPGQLRIAFNTRSPIGSEVHPECKAAVEDAAKLLADMGHRVEEAAPELDGLALALSYFTLYFGETAADIAAIGKDTGKKPARNDFELMTWFFGQLGRAISALDFVNAIRRWDEAARIMGEFHRRYDLYMIPVTAQPPARIGESGPQGMDKMMLKAASALHLARVVDWTGAIESIALPSLAPLPFTQLANFTGAPAMSVPLAWHSDGLPCGVQFLAPFGEEERLFRLAGRLEEARPWFDRRPRLAAD